jgi:hypothetical protein
MRNNRLTLGIELIDDPAWMGGMLYLQGLVLSLARLPPAEQPVVRLLGAPAAVSGFLRKWGHLPLLRDSNVKGGVVRGLMCRLRFDRWERKAIDVLYPGFGARVDGATTVRWIPDFQHRYLPGLFGRDEISAREQGILALANSACDVVFSSEVARLDFERFYPNHAARTHVWRFCSLLETSMAADSGVKTKYGLPEKFLYLPNQFWAHKNHVTVFKALGRLRREQNLLIPLVCTGAESDRRNSEHIVNLRKVISTEGIQTQVISLGLIDRAEQVTVLRCAAAIVQPSLFEGWSTVVEDVRAVGRPLFLSDIPVHREQAPPRCQYFSPQSDLELAGLLSASWNALTPGPEADAEGRARQEMELRIVESARNFCQIVRLARESPAA